MEPERFHRSLAPPLDRLATAGPCGWGGRPDPHARGRKYDDVVTGQLAGFGFALQVTSTATATSAGVTQDGSSVPTTTVAGTVRLPDTEVPPVLDAGLVQPLLVTSDEPWLPDAMLAVTGRLVVEPYLWAAEGMLWPLLPDGVRMWSVDRIRRIGTRAPRTRRACPGRLDHGATYLLELVSQAEADEAIRWWVRSTTLS